MARTVKEQSKSCLGCGLVIVGCVAAVVFYHRFIWREKQAPDLAHLNRLRMSQISKAYYTFYQQNNRYPESFQELMTPKDYVGGVHQDVWGSEYRIVEVQGIVYVYSLGPDLTDDEMEITYDPTNGAESRGDQPYVLRRRAASSSPPTAPDR